MATVEIGDILKLEPHLDTIPKVLRAQYLKYGDSKVAMRKKDRGIWRRYTWKDVYENAKWVSLGLVSLGLKPGDIVAIVGDNDPEWFWAEYATIAAGGIAVGMFVDAHYGEIKYLLEHSEAKFAFAKDQEQADKILEVKEDLPKLEKIIYWEAKGLWYYEFPFLMSYQEVQQLGKEFEKSHPGAFEENIEKGKKNDLACLCYTSGTTRTTDEGVARQRGVMYTHETLLANSKIWTSLDDWRDTDVWLSFTPPAWIAEQIFGIGACLQSGTEINFPEEPETVLPDMREAGPAFIFLSARLWESFFSIVQSKMTEVGWLKRFVYDLFLPVGYKMTDFKFRKIKPPFYWKWLYPIAYLCLFRPLKDKLGMLRVKSVFNAGAALSAENMRFFHAIGVNIRQVYGATEVGIPVAHTPDDIDPETVGVPLHPDWIKISPEGEILTRGPMVCKGYYKDPEATKELFDEDGWAHIGDAGYINERGHLVYLERVKEMETLATGKKFAPTYIEGKMRFSPYTKDCMVIGEGRDFISAIVNIDFENVSDWAEAHHIAYTTFVDLSQRKEVYDLILKDVERTNSYLPEEMKIKKFVNLHKEFDPDEAELTRTRKLRRGYMRERYGGVIDTIYSGKEEYDIEATVKYRDGRTGVTKTALKIRSVG